MNAGQMFMSMMSGVTQAVTPEAMTAVPPAGLQNKSGINFDNLLGEMRMQADTRMIANVDTAGVYAVPEGQGLPSETSETAAAMKLGAARTGATFQADGELVRTESSLELLADDVSSGALPPELSSSEAQMVLAAYAQSSPVNSPPSHEVDTAQNVPPNAVEGDRLVAGVEAPVTYPSEVAASAQLSVKTADLSASAKESATQQPVPVIASASALQENHSKPANVPVAGISGQNQAVIGQQSGRMPSVNTPPSQEVDVVQNVHPKVVEAGRPVIRTESPVTIRNPEQRQLSVNQSAEQYIQSVAVEQHDNTARSETATKAVPEISAAPVTATSGQQQVLKSPVVDAGAATPETARHYIKADVPFVELSGQHQAADIQQPGRMPSVNTPSGQEVDSVQKAQPRVAVTDQPMINAESPVMFRASEPRQPSLVTSMGQYTRTVQPEHQAIRTESAASPTTDRPVANPVEQAYRSTVAAHEQSADLLSSARGTVQQAAPLITAKPVEQASVPFQAVTAPVVEVAAAKPEPARQEMPLMPANVPTVESSRQSQDATDIQNSGRMPSVNTSSGHEVDTVQNVPTKAVVIEQPTINTDDSLTFRSSEQRQSSADNSVEQFTRLETASSTKTDRPVARTVEQTYRSVVAAPAQQFHQTEVLSASGKETVTQQASPVTTARPAEPVYVPSRAVTAPVVEVAAVQPETASQEKTPQPANVPAVESSVQNRTAARPLPAGMSSVNTPPVHDVDTAPEAMPKIVATAPQIIKSEANVTYSPVEQQQPSVNQPVLSTPAKATVPQQASTVITAKPAEPTSVPSQAVATPVVEVAAAKPETARQEKPLMPANAPVAELSGQTRDANIQPSGRMPSVNAQPDHVIDKVRSNPETNVTKDLNLGTTGLQASPGRESAPVRNEVEERAKKLHQVSAQHQGRLESAPGRDATKAVVQDVVVPEPLSETSPETGLPNRAISTQSRPETEISFAMPRPITVSKAHPTESSRLASTNNFLRQQIISLDIETPQKQSAEFGTVSASKSDTIVTPTTVARPQENFTEAVIPSAPETGLARKSHPEVTLKEADPGASVAKADETDRQASSDSRSVPINPLAGRAATQLNPGTDGENARVSSSPLSSKENGTAVQSLVPSGEAMLSSDDSMGSNGDQAGSGPKPDNQMMSHQVHAQAKSENQPVASVHGSRFNPEQSRQDLPEQVAHQVRERLGQHELKTGNQQITLTLSPENMGELKMNLNLQGQRLSVEIVTENRTVRDAILQHSDSLKETLARQNITVESFDVTSNGRGAGNPGQNQDAWRELARQKQQQLWASAGGYALPQINVTVNPAAYQAKNEHAMLDIHY